MSVSVTRREAVALAASAVPVLAAPEVDAALIARNDDYLDSMLRRQITDPQHPFRGAVPDDFNLPHPGTGSGILESGTAALVTAGSRHHRSGELKQRLELAAAMMRRFQADNGNSLLLTTNFNSTPDTAFLTYGMAGSAHIARQAGAREIEALTHEWRRRAVHGMTTSGVHTPNHRWVVCSALALLHALEPDPAAVRRVDQWLAEGIDIDEDGQYTERSTGTYNPVTNRALIVTADRLNRPALLEPVRRNLAAMMYLMHPNGEVVTEISRRQDQGTRVTMGAYWFALQYMAVKDRQPQWGALARQHADRGALRSLSTLLQFPSLRGPVPAGPLPDNYEKLFPALQVARIRRGPSSATLMLANDSRFLQVRRGDAVIEAIRFATAFFGKGQFVPQQGSKQGNSYVLTQKLDAGYYQPFDPPRRITTETYDNTRELRRRTEVCTMEHRATVTETGKGFRVRIQAHGTEWVPVAVEIHLRDGMQVEGASPAPKVADAWLLSQGHATIRAGRDALRIGPGRADHGWTQLRGALPKAAGPSIYLTGYTPFDHTLEIEAL